MHAGELSWGEIAAEISVEDAITDQTTADLLWEDTSAGNPVLSFTLAYEFGM